MNGNIAVVLGGGGMKGLAHIGVLKVLARHGIVPASYIGTSVGSLIAAMAAGGMMPEEIERIGIAVQRQDILDYDWLGLLLRRGRNRSIYRGKAYHDWVRRILPVDKFSDLKAGLYVTTVNVNDGREVVWGMQGLNDVPVHDCVVASCAIPGVYPAKQIRGHWFVDGGWADPLPVRVAVYLKASLIIAVHLDHPDSDSPANAQEAGLYDMIERGQSMLSRAITRFDLRYFKDAPLVLIEPRVQHHSLFQFDGLEECIRAGEEAAEDAVAHHPLLRTLGENPGSVSAA